MVGPWHVDRISRMKVILDDWLLVKTRPAGTVNFLLQRPRWLQRDRLRIASDDAIE